MMKKLIYGVFFLNLLCFAEIKFQSQPNTILIELYTSQGCSSCPPAERQLNSFRNNPKLWQGIIPLHFHVDYWDYLGWKDSFSSKKATQRQYQFAKAKLVSNVYTPCFIVNGKEQRQRNLTPSQVMKGELKASLIEDKLQVDYEGLTKAVILQVAFVSVEDVVDITSGENNGKKLTQNFNVIDLQSFQSPTENQWQVTLANIPRKKGYAIVVWVMTASSPVALQVAASLLPNE